MELIVRRGDEVHEVELEPDGDGWRVEVDGTAFHVDAADGPGAVRSLLVDGRQYEVSVRGGRDGRYRVDSVAGREEFEVLDPLAWRAQSHLGEGARTGPHRVEAYMPGRVVEVLVEEGATVEAGQGLVVLEAMKMENEIEAEAAGTVVKVHVEAGQPVEAGDPLFEIE